VKKRWGVSMDDATMAGIVLVIALAMMIAVALRRWHSTF
jgi:hypothetical protein